MSTLPDIRVGEPIRHQALAVFPLFSAPEGAVDYLLSDEAIQAGSVTVQEVSEGGSVPNLLVTNQGDSRVLFLEGEELRDQQNRVPNTSVPEPLPEQDPDPGQLRRVGPLAVSDKHFVSAAHSSPSCGTSSEVVLPIDEGWSRMPTREVWTEVSRQMDSLGTSSRRGDGRHLQRPTRDGLGEFRERLRYVEGATGLAVAVGTKVVALDLFDKPSTCAKVWDRLLSGVVMDALEGAPTDQVAQRADVEGLLARLRDSSWEPAPAVGEGQEFRCDADPDRKSVV
jgi:hypothetical protein